MRIQMLERHRKIHTGERPYRWTLCLSTNILNWFIFQVRQVWWGIYSKWGFKATHPTTQNKWGHPHGGGKTTDRGTEKALWIVWSKVPRSRRPEKTSQISCGYQRLCLRILRESVWIKEGDGLAHQRRAFRGKELPVQGMRKTVWSTHNFESSHAESYRRASISGFLHLCSISPFSCNFFAVWLLQCWIQGETKPAKPHSQVASQQLYVQRGKKLFRKGWRFLNYAAISRLHVITRI